MVADRRKLDIEVVLVCDAVDDGDDESFVFSPDGDRPTRESLRLIREGLEQAAQTVVHYDTLRHFTDNLHRHRDAVVFPYWFGAMSRSRHSLVPAICEAYGLTYVGADAYSKTVCNDKFLSKPLCELAGLVPAPGFLLTCAEDLGLLEQCSYPLVVKPNFQGSSLGIDDSSLAYTPQDARAVAERTAHHFGWPVLCETFITGRETSICLMGSHRRPMSLKMLSWEMNGDPGFLDNRIFSYTLKNVTAIEFRPVLLDEPPAPLRLACERLFVMLDKAEIMRIDGRMTQNGFVVMELSPDLDLRPDGEVAVAFKDTLPLYALFLRRLLANALERAGRQAPMHDEC